MNRYLTPWLKLAALLLPMLWGVGSPARAAGPGPSLMVIMQEKVMGVLGTTGYEQPNQAELSLMEHFSRLGYRVVDPATVKRNRSTAGETSSFTSPSPYLQALSTRL